MVTPVLSGDEQRAAAREKAVIARRQRRELLEQIAAGRISIAAVLARADTDPLVAKTRVIQLLRAMPGCTRQSRLMP